jgi:type IV pilus assembly protein PilA
MKKGFTLVELLAVIVILGVLAVIIIPPVMNNVNATRKASYDQLISNIEETTQLYVRENRNDIQGISQVGNTVTITLQTLVDKEDLKTPIIDPRTNTEIDLSTQISVLVKPQNKYKVVVGQIIYVD